MRETTTLLELEHPNLTEQERWRLAFVHHMVAVEALRSYNIGLVLNDEKK